MEWEFAPGRPRSAGVVGEAVFFGEFFQVRCECQRGCWAELRGDLGPGGVEEVVAASEAGLEGLHETAFAVEAVGDVFIELRGGVPDVWAVARAKHREIEVAQAAQGVEVVGQ